MKTTTYWLTALGAGVLYFVLGALWYAPFAFGPSFNEALGFAPGITPPNTPAMFVGPFVGCVGAALGLATLARQCGVTTRGALLKLSLTLSGLFSVTAVLIDATAPNQHATMTLVAIVGGYHVVGQALVALVLLSQLARPR